MKRIHIHSNCQGGAIQLFLERALDMRKYVITRSINNDRLGDYTDENSVHNALDAADIIICHPLYSNNVFHTQRIREEYSKSLILCMPFIVNTGMTSFSYGPSHPVSPIGKIYGYEYIYPVLKEYSLEKTLELYKCGRIDFDLQSRFLESLSDLERREIEFDTAVIVSDFIKQYYKDRYLFITMSHPTSIIWDYVCSKICSIIGEQYVQFTTDLNYGRLPYNGQPVSPYDVTTMGYTYSHHSDWYEKGKFLIEKLYNSKTNGIHDRSMFAGDLYPLGV